MAISFTLLRFPSVVNRKGLLQSVIISHKMGPYRSTPLLNFKVKSKIDPTKIASMYINSLRKGFQVNSTYIIPEQRGYE